MGIKSLRTFAKGGIWCFVTYPYIPKILGGFSFVVLGRIDEQDTMRFCSKTYPGRRKGRGRRHCACANRVVIPTKSVSFQSPGAQYLIIQQWRTLCSQALEWGQYTRLNLKQPQPFPSYGGARIPKMMRFTFQIFSELYQLGSQPGPARPPRLQYLGLSLSGWHWDRDHGAPSQRRSCHGCCWVPSR